MKKAICALLLISVWMVSCQTQNGEKSNSYNLLSNDFRNVPQETKTFEVGNFSAIEVSSVIKATIRKSSENKVVVTSNAMQYVTVRNSGGTLKLSYNTPRNGLNNVNTEVIVYTSDFSKIEGDSASKITVENGFQLDHLTVELESACKMEGSLNAENLHLEMDGASKLTGNIKANILKAEVDSASKLDAQLDVQTLEVDADSASKTVFTGKADHVKISAKGVSKVDISALKYENIQEETSTLAKIKR